MSFWGIGLYSSDFAKDLRQAVRALSRLPFGAGRLLEFLCEAEPSAANDPEDPDHTLFWLVVADQFAKRGIDCSQARDKALAIIRGGTNLASMKALGMDDKSLAKRRGMLEEMQGRLAAPVPARKPRAVLNAPQKLLLEVGDVLTYPVGNGRPVNPYASENSALRKEWRQNGLGAFAVAERGVEFEFLAWYRPLVICEPLPAEPALADILAPRVWLSRNPGTLTARHAARMQLKPLGRVAIDAAKLSGSFPKRMSPRGCVVSDISIANNISVLPLGVHEVHRVKHGYPPTPHIRALSDVTRIA